MKTFNVVTKSKPVGVNLGSLLVASFTGGLAYTLFKSKYESPNAQQVQSQLD